jgi:hypothetical protein
MEEQFMKCPFCNRDIPLSQALSHQVKEKLRSEVEREYAQLSKELKSKEQEIHGLKERIEREAKRKAEESLSVELKDLRARIEEKEAQLSRAQGEELKLRKLQRELEDRNRNMELELARKLEQQHKEMEEKLERTLGEKYRLKMVEKEKRIEELARRIDELQLKAEEGSQRIQGEALEIDLELLLKRSFPDDIVERVPKGRRGADILQRIHSQSGEHSGCIVWEAKRTRNWSDGWIKKLKEDQRRAKADIAVIVSRALPSGVSGFALVDGVWISDYDSAAGLGAALRIMLNRVANEKRIACGKDEKMESLYHYLTGAEFSQRVEAVVDAFASMRKELDQERRAIERAWAKREKQIQQGIFNIAGMYGEMQGIVGASLPQVSSLELKALNPASEVRGKTRREDE